MRTDSVCEKWARCYRHRYFQSIRANSFHGIEQVTNKLLCLSQRSRRKVEPLKIFWPKKSNFRSNSVPTASRATALTKSFAATHAACFALSCSDFELTRCEYQEEDTKARPNRVFLHGSGHSPAAEAGIQEEDVITAIYGHPTKEFTITQIRKMFMRDGKEYLITLKRGPKKCKQSSS